MKKKLPFVVKYTKEMSKEFNKKLMESCPMTDPTFYKTERKTHPSERGWVVHEKWDLVTFGTSEYDERFKVTRKDVEEKN